MIWSIVGLNTAILVAIGFLFGHCNFVGLFSLDTAIGAKKKYPDGKCNFVGFFSPIVTLIWIVLFATQGIMFYIFSTHADQTLRSLGQWLYWVVVLLIWSYFLVGVFVLPSTAAGKVRLQTVTNIISTLIFGLVTWEMLLFGVVLADAQSLSHLSRTYIYTAAGMQSMA